MNEYKKKLAEQAGKVNRESAQPEMTNGIPNSVLNDVFAGKRHADSSMMGHKMPLPPSIAAKMQQSFGMDLTQLSVYQSDAMSGTDMKGISQGNKVVLSSDVDLNTAEGQAVLGHELSHIHAQAQGIGMGHGGLYNNAGLEAQADREGMLAAHGRPIYEQGITGNPGMSYGLGMQGVEGLTPLSGGISASAGAPMQAKKDTKKRLPVIPEATEEAEADEDAAYLEEGSDNVFTIPQFVMPQKRNEEDTTIAQEFKAQKRAIKKRIKNETKGEERTLRKQQEISAYYKKNPALMRNLLLNDMLEDEDD